MWLESGKVVLNKKTMKEEKRAYLGSKSSRKEWKRRTS